jgi:uncharacterized membrane protein
MGRPAANTGLEGAAVKQRNDWLDLWRSLAVLTMLVFHALWDLELFGVLPAGTMETPAADVVRYLGGGSFILISGMLVLRSRDGLRRGFRIFCVGFAVAAVTALIGLPVKFGILQLLGACMMGCSALRERLAKLPRGPFACVFLLLFGAFWYATERIVPPWNWLYPLGFRRADFVSADYWPLLPWAFLYLFGTQIAPRLFESGAGGRRLPAALTFLGRHSLVIYLAHQPVFYGLCLLFLRKTTG